MPESINSVLSSMMDTSLLKNPVFMIIGISNVFGMAGLYVPFVYLVDAAKESVSLKKITIYIYIYHYRIIIYIVLYQIFSLQILKQVKRHSCCLLLVLPTLLAV